MPLERSATRVPESVKVLISAPRPIPCVIKRDGTGRKGGAYLHVIQPLFTWKPPARMRYRFASAEEDDMTGDTSRREECS